MAGLLLISLGLQLGLLIATWTCVSAILYASYLQPVQRSYLYYPGATNSRALLGVVQRCQGILLGLILLVALPELATYGKQLERWSAWAWHSWRIPIDKLKNFGHKRYNDDVSASHNASHKSLLSQSSASLAAEGHSRFWLACFILLSALRIAILVICAWLLTKAVAPANQANESSQYSPTISTDAVDALAVIISKINTAESITVGWIAVSVIEASVGFYRLGQTRP
ncbi:hypothetical protein BDZ88DRAFT_448972 [Geranomyces variabilis]|nr:hypothetical protein BDZ88DRAFT_448972 [Geranomyces variabilis]KAJ3139660.1 hypothetical protein HDU90_009161 [Geranomyces variabilis]